MQKLRLNFRRLIIERNMQFMVLINRSEKDFIHSFKPFLLQLVLSQLSVTFNC